MAHHDVDARLRCTQAMHGRRDAEHAGAEHAGAEHAGVEHAGAEHAGAMHAAADARWRDATEPVVRVAERYTAFNSRGAECHARRPSLGGERSLSRPACRDILE